MADKLFLFDMDGILFDTMPHHVRSWKQVSDEYGIVAEEGEFYLYEGMRGVDTIRQLYERTFAKTPDVELVNEIYHRKTEIFNNDDFELVCIPGTRDVMSYLKSKGQEIAVVTGSTANNAYPRIEKHYADFISLDHIITAESVERGKPFPDPYLMGMELFGRKPEETIVIENAPLGVKSGHDAGAFVIAVTTGPIEEYVLREHGSDLVFADMQALLVWCRRNI
ncbi:MAG: HAD-IA family hydrolase [Porphyromonas sp.]|nr:HAD-IA family hydrolase [Porphyromonas sp.]